MRRMTSYLLLGGIVGWGGASALYAMYEGAQDAFRSPPVATVTSESRSISIESSPSGTFYVDGRVHDIPVRFVLDSGAYNVSFNAETAKKLGLKWENGRASCYWTANGDTCGVDMTVDELDIGGIVMKGVNVSISAPGKLRMNLLGMSFLRRLSGFKYSRSENRFTLVE